MTGDDADSPPETGSHDHDDAFDRLFRRGERNARLAWVAVGLLGVAFLVSALEGRRHWIVFVTGVLVVVLIPPAAYREWHVMLPWELLVLAAVPAFVRGLVGGPAGTFAAYVGVACLALIVTVELHMFTALDVTHWFAVTFVVLTTLASVAAWTVVRWYLDRWFGTSYLSTNEALMIEWLWVALAGLVAGLLFDAYFQRRDRQLRQAIAAVVGR